MEVRGSSTGETVQAVFDLGSGRFRGGANADGGTSSVDGGEPESLDPNIESVLEELRETDVNRVPPIGLLARVQEWHRWLDGE